MLFTVYLLNLNVVRWNNIMTIITITIETSHSIRTMSFNANVIDWNAIRKIMREEPKYYIHMEHV